MRRMMGMIAACVLAIAAQTAHGAETVHLKLKANGVAIAGESTQISLGRANTIECVALEFPATMLSATGAYGRTPQYKPLMIRKRIDKSSPLLLKAMVQGQVINGVFLFFRPNPTGDGTTEQFYTVTIDGGYITSLRQYVPDTITPSSSNTPPLEEVTFSFEKLTVVYTNGDIGFTTANPNPIAKTGVSAKAWPAYDAQESAAPPQSAITPEAKNEGRAKAQALNPKRAGARETKMAARHDGAKPKSTPGARKATGQRTVALANAVGEADREVVRKAE